MDLGKAIIDLFILILVVAAGWYIYVNLGDGIPIIQNIAIAMMLICGAAIFVLIGYVVVEVLQV